MARPDKVLIVGGGIAGMSCAIQLAKIGSTVTLVDADPDWRVYGAGITITGPTYRAFREIGIVDEVIAAGFACRGARARTCEGALLDEIVDVGLEPGIPYGGGIMRPRLHRILSRRTLQSGAGVKLGITVTGLAGDHCGVEVSFSNHGQERFDLVVGADGINSGVRSLAFPEAPTPRFTGQGAWRVVAPRPAGLDMIEMYLGNCIKAGVTPISDQQLYMFTLTREDGGQLSPEQHAGRMREALKDFGGLIGEIRDTLGPNSPIVYRPLEAVLLPPPWYRGRIVLIGDAVHATTPQLASGAGCAVEDAIVLADELARARSVDDALAAFTDRRFERCRDVVETSLRLGEMELADAPGEEQSRLYAEATRRLTAAI